MPATCQKSIRSDARNPLILRLNVFWVRSRSGLVAAGNRRRTPCGRLGFRTPETRERERENSHCGRPSASINLKSGMELGLRQDRVATKYRVDRTILKKHRFLLDSILAGNRLDLPFDWAEFRFLAKLALRATLCSHRLENGHGPRPTPGPGGYQFSERSVEV